MQGWTAVDMGVGSCRIFGDGSLQLTREDLEQNIGAEAFGGELDSTADDGVKLDSS